MTKLSYAAEEIVQEIFAGLWESRASLADIDSLSAYIFTVAYHKAFGYLKRAAADAELLQSLKERMSAVNIRLVSV